MTISPPEFFTFFLIPFYVQGHSLSAIVCIGTIIIQVLFSYDSFSGLFLTILTTQVRYFVDYPKMKFLIFVCLVVGLFVFLIFRSEQWTFLRILYRQITTVIITYQKCIPSPCHDLEPIIDVNIADIVQRVFVFSLIKFLMTFLDCTKQGREFLHVAYPSEQEGNNTFLKARYLHKLFDIVQQDFHIVPLQMHQL